LKAENSAEKLTDCIMIIDHLTPGAYHYIFTRSTLC